MKICFFGADFPPTGGGIATYSYDWMVETSRHSKIQKVVALIFGNKIPRREIIGKDIEVQTLSGRSFFYTGFTTLIFILQHFDYDLFHSLNLFPVGFWVVFWSKLLGRRSAVTFYGTDACSTLASRKTVYLKKWTILHATKAIALSEATKKNTISRLSLKRQDIKVLYPVVPKVSLEFSGTISTVEEIKNIRHKYKLAEDDFVVLNVSRLVKRKGIEYLIEGASLLKGDKVKILLVGSGPEEKEILNMIKQKGVEDSVTVVGKVPNLEVFYKIANVVTLVSYFVREEYDFEGLGLVLLEAQSFGLPVIGTDSGGIPEAFKDGETGFLVPEKNAKAIAEKIKILKGDQERARKMGKAGVVFVPEKFNATRNIEQYIDFVGKK